MAAPIRSPWLAVDAVTDRPAHARSLRRVHDAFHSGHEVAGHVRAVVAQSWARSGEAGIDPSEGRAPVVVDEDAIADRWEHHPLYAVLPVLRDLLSDATTRAGHMLVISDARGVLLWIEGHQHVIEATENMHFVCGADWSEQGAGTNALGTAIAVDHPVQIFSAEHFSRLVHPWQCSGAPIHDPETGEIIGVVDLTGHLKTAHPHTLSLVSAAAGMAEAYLRSEQQRRTERLRELYCARIAGTAHPTALLNEHGRVIMSVPHGWVDGTLQVAPGGADVTLADGTSATAEPLGAGHVVWRQPRPSRTPAGPQSAALHARVPRRTPPGSHRGPGWSPSVCARPSCSHSSRCVPRGSPPSSWPSRCTATGASPSPSAPRSAACAMCSAKRCGRGPTGSPSRSTATSRPSSACSRPVSWRERSSATPISSCPTPRSRSSSRHANASTAPSATPSSHRPTPTCSRRGAPVPAGRDDQPAAELLLGLLPVDDERHPAARARAQRLRRSEDEPELPPAW